ncbi:MAG TPA: hypothetical protein PL045_06215 [Chitinophagaceae bacterium]|nr:hypothetical protein [Chitinophagaceae bacterium]
MANGFVPYLLMNQMQVFKGASPSQKITPPGYLKMLLANTKPNIVDSNVADGSGHLRDIKIKYRPRVPKGVSSTTDDCSVQAQPVYLEATVPSVNFRKYGFIIADATIAAYEKEASTSLAIGKPAPPNGIIMELYKHMLEAANGLLGDVNDDLLTAQAAAFGKNVTTGLATTKTINFPLATTSNPLTQGLTMLMNDVMENEIRADNFIIVGSGLINAVYLQQSLNTSNTKDANYPGIVPPYYWDPATASKFGSNQFGVFEKNAVQLININKFAGFIGGDKFSTFLFTLSLPLVDSLGGTELQSFTFDVQLKYQDCPEEIDIAGTPTSVGRGWRLDLMCNYNQFNLPSDAYDSADRLTGNNGTLRYTATNS